MTRPEDDPLWPPSKGDIVLLEARVVELSILKHEQSADEEVIHVAYTADFYTAGISHVAPLGSVRAIVDRPVPQLCAGDIIRFKSDQPHRRAEYICLGSRDKGWWDVGMGHHLSYEQVTFYDDPQAFTIIRRGDTDVQA